MFSIQLRALPLLCCSVLPALGGEVIEGVVLPYRQVELSAPVSSRLVDIKVKEGDAVQAGQPLAQLYSRLEELEMQRAKALLERKDFEAKGAKKLFENKVIPEAKALEFRIDLELAHLNYETAAEQVRLRTILSPIDGVIVERTKEVGEAVSASQTVFRILDMSKLFILCQVKPDKLNRLAVGQKLAVRVPHLGVTTSFSAEVVHMDPCANANGLFRLKLLVEKPGAWVRTGLKAMVELPDNL